MRGPSRYVEEQLCHLNTGAIVLSLQKPQVCPEVDAVPSQKNLGHAKSRDVRISCTCQGSVIKPMGVQEAGGLSAGWTRSTHAWCTNERSGRSLEVKQTVS